MRELKFRAWVNDHWTDWLPTIKTLGLYNEVLIDEDDYSTDSKCYIEQYTGLKDKNGKEVYEGDLVEVKDVGRFEVKWYDEIASFLFKPNMQMKYHPPFNSYQMSVCEVIGNIHESNMEELCQKE